MYILFDDFTIGKISYICDCDACKKRENLEAEIVDSNGVYLFHRTVHELSEGFRSGEILTFGENIEDIMLFIKNNIVNKKDKELVFLQSIIDFLNKTICDTKENVANG